jgi:hypothetical protein
MLLPGCQIHEVYHHNPQRLDKTSGGHNVIGFAVRRLDGLFDFALCGEEWGRVR